MLSCRLQDRCFRGGNVYAFMLSVSLRQNPFSSNVLPIFETVIDIAKKGYIQHIRTT